MDSSSPLLASAALPALVTLIARSAGMTGLTLLRAAAGSAWASFGASAALAALAASGLVAIDMLGLAMALLTSFVGAIVLSFSVRHMKADRRLSAYALRVSLLIASVLALVAAQDLIVFALAWAASGVLLAQLIGHVPGWVEAEAAKKRARTAFVVGDGALLAALLLLGAWAGSLSIADVIAAAPTLPMPLAALACALILVGAMARSALPPFHKWLMGSMTAPTPVSALMHAGVVNAGGFLLIRFAPLLEAVPAVKVAAVLIGATGALFGIGVMIVRPDIKRALGGSTVAQMSFMIMTCGLGAYTAALWHLIAHGLFKSWAFLGAGSSIARARPAALASWSPAASVMVTALALALVIAAFGTAGALSLPLPILLALVAALTGVAGAARADGKAVPNVLVTSLGLVLAYVAGFAAIENLPGLPAGASPLPLLGQVALLATFLFAWVWQTARLPIPAPLYVRMLNTGGPALIR